MPATVLNNGQKETTQREKQLHLLERVRISGPLCHQLHSSKNLSKLQHQHPPWPPPLPAPLRRGQGLQEPRRLFFHSTTTRWQHKAHWPLGPRQARDGSTPAHGLLLKPRRRKGLTLAPLFLMCCLGVTIEAVVLASSFQFSISGSQPIALRSPCICRIFIHNPS